jgi:hypothetical protein
VVGRAAAEHARPSCCDRKQCDKRGEMGVGNVDDEKPRAEGVVESYEELESRKIERESEGVS